MLVSIERLPELAKVTIGAYRKELGIVIRKGEHRIAVHRHHWAPCDVCGEGTYVSSDRINQKTNREDGTVLIGIACRMTPGCSGRHRKPQPQEEK